MAMYYFCDAVEYVTRPQMYVEETIEETRQRVAHRLRRARKQGFRTRIIERGREWEIFDPFSWRRKSPLSCEGVISLEETEEDIY